VGLNWQGGNCVDASKGEKKKKKKEKKKEKKTKKKKKKKKIIGKIGVVGQRAGGSCF